MKTLTKGNHAVRIRNNAGSLLAIHLCNFENGFEGATVLESKSFGTENGAKRWANKILA